MNTTNSFDPEAVLMEFHGDLANDNWTISNAMEGVQIFGGIGSGKTSGSGRTLASKYLKAGFGGLVLTVKPDERAEWEKYCKDAGRSNDLIIIEPGGKHFFNFLEYESKHTSKGSSITENIVHVLKTVLNASNEKDVGKSNDAFWDNALDMLLSNVIDLNKLAYGNVTVQSIYEIVQSIPKKDTNVNDGDKKLTPFSKAIELSRKNVTQKIDAWEQGLDVSTLAKITQNGTYETEAYKAVPEFRLLKFLDEFFFDHFISLNEKTRSIVEFSFSGFLFRLLRDPIYTLFCNTPSTLEPEDSLKGKIILLDLPVKIYDKAGRDCQIMFKYIWQRAMEKRAISKLSPPVFLWADEAQNFIHEYDADYQATARSSRICTVYLTQNISNYHAKMGGQHAEHKVKSFLGTLNTKIFHANSDIETNKYASELIGDSYYEKLSTGKNVGVGNISQSSNSTLELRRTVRPEAFSKLLTGSDSNNNIVEAYLHRQGKVFSTGRSIIKTRFKQPGRHN